MTHPPSSNDQQRMRPERAHPKRQRSSTRSGIVLRRWKTPRGDLIVSVLTPQGKLKAVARGGMRGKYAGPLNLFHHVGLQVYARAGDDLAVVQQAVLEGALAGLAQPERHAYAHLLAELADNLFQEGEGEGNDAGYSAGAFDLLAGGLRGVARHEDPEWVALVLSYKLLALAGFPPRTGQCVRCRAPQPTHPDPFGGELLCATCSRGRALPESTLDFMRHAGSRTVREHMNAPVPEEARPQLWQMLERFVGTQVGPLRSWGEVGSWGQVAKR